MLQISGFSLLHTVGYGFVTCYGLWTHYGYLVRIPFTLAPSSFHPEARA